ncbi:MAG TPA: hypothetical protein VHE33_03090 [Acidobacteriaceae bacterium]|nr:hypothetical protein [Acidobacteriaceae bacterium]
MGPLSVYFRCPGDFLEGVRVAAPAAAAPAGYFAFGPETTLYGRLAPQVPAASPEEPLHDASADVAITDGAIGLPFDPREAIANLRHEAYTGGDARSGTQSLAAKIYYFFRPLLSVAARKHLQKLRLRNWNRRPFPRWPVDFSVDNLHEQLLVLALRASGIQHVPFIWFWPEGHSACAMMSHDIETEAGRDFCATLMDLDDSRGIKGSFTVIPEERYEVPQTLIDSIHDRGHEVAVHDLNHDGHLYDNRAQFLERVSKINEYGRKFGASGFRAGVLYRNQDWFNEFQFAYDMSVPNVAHLDPQRGGCCTVMPYFIGDLLEIPLTDIQDYSLFHILNEYSTDIWKQQTAMILARHGLMSFIVHPDYIIEPEARATFEALLDHLAHLRDTENVWTALPREINQWWRQRAAMTLVRAKDGWRIEGAGAERARIAWAREIDGKLFYSVEPAATAALSPSEKFHLLSGFRPLPGRVPVTDDSSAEIA